MSSARWGQTRPFGARQTRIGSAMLFNECAPEILKFRTYLSTNLPVRVVGNAKTTRLCDTFELHCNIDTVAKDIIVFDDDVTDVIANAKFDPLVLGHIGILFGRMCWILSAHRTASTTLANSCNTPSPVS